MGWFDRLVGRKSISDSGELHRFLLGGRTAKSGVTVNLNSTLRVSTAIACGRVISEGIAQTPFKMMRQRGDTREVQSDNPLHQLLTISPNDWMTAFELFEQIALHCAFCGNAYVFVTRGFDDKILELLPLQPQWMRVQQREDWTLRYFIRFPSKAEIEVPTKAIWHLRGPSWACHTGLDTIDLARNALGLAIATEQFGSSLFAQGGRPGGLLSTAEKLSGEQQENIRQKWKEAHEGPENSMRTAILGGGLKYESMSMTSDEAQFMATRAHAVEEICRFMRVLPIMVGHTGDKASTYASAEQMMIAHLVHTLGPWFNRIEQSAMKNLLTAAQRRDGYYLKFFPNGLLRGAAKDRAEYYAKALGAGGSPAWMTQDEVRALEDANPMGGAAAVLPIATNIGGAAPQSAE